MEKTNNEHSSQIEYVYIVPHTHWDRDWYLPFQKFRHKLVKLIDELLDILNKRDFYFTFDGQTIILEDYFEIRPENREKLLQYIRERKISIGPWYLLPDIWLVGQESLLRNLEYSFDLAKEFDIPLMNIGYLPDMFGHSRAIPQIIGDLTDFDALVVWRGVPPEITTVPFIWKSDTAAKTSMLTIYLPFGYGNASNLPKEANRLSDEIKNLVNQLKPFSPIPAYLLNHGTDHQVPNGKMASALQHVRIEGKEITLGILDDFILKFQQLMEQQEYIPPEYTGELRSAARAHLLQDTYSARMWIKQWNQKVEDLLIHYAEPLNAYTWYYLNEEYPTSFLTQAWKWHLRNQPHDSICGCSIDQTHEEMKFRYSYAESIAESSIEEALGVLEAATTPTTESSILIFNPTNCVDLPIYFEIKASVKDPVRKLKTSNGEEYEVQSIGSSSDKVWEMTVGSTKLKALMKMLPGRQIMGLYINDVTFFDGESPEVCEVHIMVADKPVGDLDAGILKKNLLERINSKKYKKFHILVSREPEQTYAILMPLTAWGFSSVTLSSDPIVSNSPKTLSCSKDSVNNDYYDITFHKDGTFDLKDKINNIVYNKLHQFEDWGDRGDEYTFGRLGPELIEVNEVRRKVNASGPLVCEITQTMKLSVFQEVDSKREKRIGKTKIPVNTTFRFYRDLSRIDVKTSLINTAKDHRLRICFDLPFKSQRTFTATHFGYIKRFGDPIGNKTYIEEPSGIQPQKRFIRVENENGQGAITLMNQGLPEVELVKGTRLAITLIRSIGWLSRSGIPERPEHAGPYYETPGAQELNETYSFNYSFITHSKEEPFFRSADHSEAFSLVPITSCLNHAHPREEYLNPIIRILDPKIRLSSLRVRHSKIYVTIFNMSDETGVKQIQFPKTLTELAEIKIDGSEKSRIKLSKGKVELFFDPYEIKMCSLM
ncbi:MAG: glycoside hydrolase family 38 C-terminal domain-containing protein [Candidatus Hodarchaeota archaeon]